MGRFFTDDDIPSRKKYPHGDPVNWDWHIGDFQKNFPYKFIWYEEDRIDWSRETHRIENRVDLRRWCERELNGDIYIKSIHDSKFVYYNKKEQYGDGYLASASRIEFCFELESDLLAFKLRWM